MWNRLAITFEIIGYSRAIGVLSHEPQVKASHVNTLIAERDKLYEKLRRLRDQRKLPIHKRFMTGGVKVA